MSNESNEYSDDIDVRVNTENKTLKLPHTIEHEGAEYIKRKMKNGNPVFYDAEDFVLNAFKETKTIKYENVEDNIYYKFKLIEYYPSKENPAYIEFEFTHDIVEDGETIQVYQCRVYVIRRLWSGWTKDLMLPEWENPFAVFADYYRGESQSVTLTFNNVSDAVNEVFGLSPTARVR